ncbi:MAG: hypothetical protein OXC53_00380, partial [Rhodobacteraceae bacterium]|nr:hypothetical protein [Paracoccaceae bacterium]
LATGSTIKTAAISSGCAMRAGGGGLAISVRDFDPSAFSEYTTATRTGFPAASLVPLVLPRLVDGRCLFLDADTLVLGDVHELLSFDLGGLPLGACPDIGQTTLLDDRFLRVRMSDIFRPTYARRKREAQFNRVLNLGFLPGEDYFNSGVLLMDCAAIRSDPSFESLSDIERLRPHFHFMPDQDRLNEAFRGRWAKLPLKWNVRPGVHADVGRRRRKFRYASTTFLAQMDEAAESPHLWHYMGGKKPWKKLWGYVQRRPAFRDYAPLLKEFEATTGLKVL